MQRVKQNWSKAELHWTSGIQTPNDTTSKGRKDGGRWHGIKAKGHLTIQAWRSLKEERQEMWNEGSQNPQSTSRLLLIKKIGWSDSKESVIWCNLTHSYRFLLWAAFTHFSKGCAWPYSLVLFINHILSPGQVFWTVKRFLFMTKTIDFPLFPPETFPQGN